MIHPVFFKSILNCIHIGFRFRILARGVKLRYGIVIIRYMPHATKTKLTAMRNADPRRCRMSPSITVQTKTAGPTHGMSDTTATRKYSRHAADKYVRSRGVDDIIRAFHVDVVRAEHASRGDDKRRRTGWCGHVHQPARRRVQPHRAFPTQFRTSLSAKDLRLNFCNFSPS